MMLRPFGVAVLKGAGTGGSGGTGPAGPAGADGADGAPGASAYQVAVENGFVGTEAQWLASLVGPPGADGAAGPQGDPGPAGADSTVPGPTGASAYQVAGENGFVGTEAQWLASLVGPPGADGAAGPQGEPGPKGDTGAQGPEGPQGIQGPAGDTQSIKVALTGTAITPTDAGLFTKTITGPTTLSVSAVPASPVVTSFILELTDGGTGVTFWPGIKWPGGTAPTLTASGRDVIGFYTHDGGASWVGLILGKDVL